ncbi:MAG: hypothetical protein K2X48_06935 [Chitinophagaceae bacterium]|nr:hypothetical protein [Chitinophagaceae bacterium]
MRNLLFLLVLTQTTITSYSQQTIALKITDSISGLPVGYASIHLKNKKNVVDADSSGVCNFTFTPDQSICISRIGYFEKCISASELLNNYTITLTPKRISLPFVFVGNFNSLIIGGGNKKVGFAMTAKMNERSGFASLIKVPENIGLYTIKEIEFLIRSKGKNNTCNPVRVQVCKVSEDGNPGETLMKHDIVVTSINIQKNKLNINLEEEDITISDRSFFIVIEWLTIPQGNINYGQPQICFTSDVKKDGGTTWFRGAFTGDKWYFPKAGQLGNMIANAEMLIRQYNDEKK